MPKQTKRLFWTLLMQSSENFPPAHIPLESALQQSLTKAELLKRLLIADLTFLTTKEKLLLQENVTSASELAALDLVAIEKCIKRTFKRVSWNGPQLLAKAQTAAKLIDALGIHYTFFKSPDYPALLREIPDPPYALFYRGRLSALSEPCVSVVGTRRATAGAQKAALSFAREAASGGCTVVSGLAYGIDVAAHKGALESECGATVAVLASGIDTISPSAHTKVARRILDRGGCIMSEYTPGTPAVAFRFVQRDRLIAALAPATVIIQAPSGSGALITASFALEYGRDVLFHAEAFSAESQLLERNNREKLHLQLAQGRNVAYKIENSPEKYLSDGAPVIHSFAEYCACRAAAPGTAFCKKEESQIHLF